MPGDAAPLSRRAVVRAVLAVLWLLTCAVAAIPDFGRASADANWNDPRVVDGLGAWAKVLGQEQKAFVATLKSIASTGGDIREALLTPFRPIL